jgi:crossover junction endodeoxyribonuclease RuvC
MPTPSSKIYLGIDPGSTIIGYGVVEDTGATIKPLAWGVIRNPGKDSAEDKKNTRDALEKLIQQWQPHSAAIEKLFFLNNQKSAMAVSEMRGVLILTLADHNILTHEFTPLQVKLMVCGHGSAKKPQIQKMVGMLLNIREPIEPDDAADGLAIALCCATATKIPR